MDSEAEEAIVVREERMLMEVQSETWKEECEGE